MRIVLSVVQSCSGDVRHQSNRFHLLAIESIFIKDVCNCTLIIADKGWLKIKTISALRAGSFAVFFVLIFFVKEKSVEAVATPGKASANDVMLHTDTEKEHASVCCQHKEGSGKSISI